jgi:hypothetical protein
MVLRKRYGSTSTLRGHSWSCSATRPSTVPSSSGSSPGTPPCSAWGSHHQRPQVPLGGARRRGNAGKWQSTAVQYSVCCSWVDPQVITQTRPKALFTVNVTIVCSMDQQRCSRSCSLAPGGNPHHTAKFRYQFAASVAQVAALGGACDSSNQHVPSLSLLSGYGA